ncbi:hypothetical protein GOP47_0026953 [Adiantum capillus-veneris]|nr:hypothetical protein GOP47_0026953 [Adiantum capillus-veneris]
MEAPTVEPSPSESTILFFASSPMAPSIENLEDIPIRRTPGGSKTVEFRSTDVDPLSTGAARRVLEKRGVHHKTLLASRVRARRRISTSADSSKRPKFDDSDGVMKELRALKVLVEFIPSMKNRLDKLEAANPDLYTPLAINRELAVTNLIHACLRTLDGVVCNVTNADQSLSILVGKGSPWPRKSLRELKYSNLWWTYYNQTIHDPTVPVEAYFSRILGVQIAAPASSTFQFVRKSKSQQDMVVDTIIPKVMQPAEERVIAYLLPNDAFDLRNLMGCYLSIYKGLRNESIHLFERMLSFGSDGQWVPNNATPIQTAFLLDQSLSMKDLEALRAILTDIIEHLDGLGPLQPFRPLVKALAERLEFLVVKDMGRPDGWELCPGMPDYFISPDEWFYYNRMSGEFFTVSSDGTLVPYAFEGPC